MTKKENKQTGLIPRPPIVAVLGHVDHGKTSLLDKIRQTRIAEKEAGGITQKTGAYQIEINNQKITFIDTPGHQAFSAMRSRGARVADIVVLVVAADDGVMPQTMESINHINEADVPYLIAINKIDLPGVNIEMVKSQLTQNGILTEGHGGEIVCVPVSAKTGEGIDNLLEMILLLAQMQEIKADPNGQISGVVIESRKDQRGISGTVIVKNGTLRAGDQVNLAGVNLKVKGLFDQNGKLISQAEPGQPVEVLGFKQLPPVGGEINQTGETKIEKVKEERGPQFNTSDNLKIIIKTDSLGSQEALKASLPSEVAVILIGIGDVTESDVLLARTSQAEIWGFGIKASLDVAKLAESEGVEIKTYKIIYEFIENIEKRILTYLEPTIEETILGRAEIMAKFEIDHQLIAGGRVLEGRINKADFLHLKRGDKIIGDARVASLKQQKEDVGEVQKGEEFGIRFSDRLDFLVGDMLISYRSISAPTTAPKKT